MNNPQLRKLLHSYYFELLEQTDASLLFGEEYEAILEPCGPTRILSQWDLALTMIDTMLSWLDDPLYGDRGYLNGAKSGRLDDQEKIGQINRWLGFVQGVLWSVDMRSINQMREENRPVFKSEDPSDT